MRRFTRSRPTGFTLLELLVVLALIALVSAVAVPASVQMLQAARDRALQRELQLVLSGLPLEAFRSGAALELQASALQARFQDWPAGWSFELERPLAYSAQGVARGGRVILRTRQGREQVWEVEPFTGSVRRLQVE